MTPRIFFFDIDNTLLDHRTLAIPPSALEAIAELKDNGHTVVVATGRSYGHARPFVEQVAADYVITQNGARILHHGEEVLSTPLDRASLVALFEWAESQGIPYGSNLGEHGFISKALPTVVGPMDSVEMPYQSEDRAYLHRPTHQAWLFFEAALDDTLFPFIRERFTPFELVRWHETGVDVMPRSVNKWTGCQWVLAQTGFAAKDAIAFGDGLNDIQMLQGVGLGIAMDNGHPELKAVADRIAPALHLDGIALMLEQLKKTLPLQTLTGD